MANNNVRINSNEIFEAGAQFNGIQMTEIVKKNILDDYQIGGVKTLEVNTFLTNIKNTSNIIVKNIKNGDLIDVNDICILYDRDGSVLYKNANGEAILWKVISRTFRFVGEPLLTLKLQEVKKVGV